MSTEIREIPETAMPHPAAVRRVRDAEPASQLEVSVYLKPHPEEAEAAGQGRRETREQMRARRTVEYEHDILQVTTFAARHDLRVVSVAPERRLVRLAGSVAQLSAAFRTSLGVYDAGEGEFLSYRGSLSVPADLGSRIESILGLDTRPVARPHVAQAAAATASNIHLPSEMAGLYNFPLTANGAGECVAIIEQGGGYLNSDIAAAFQAMELPEPTIVAVSVDGAKNNPGYSTEGDIETALDIQVCGGLAWGARLAVYFAPNTSTGFVDALSAATHDITNHPSAISVSWGAPESTWGTSVIASVDSTLQDAATLGLSVFASSGNKLAPDGITTDGKAHVHFPASSPSAIGCGGTTITTSGSSIVNEVVWNHIGVGGEPEGTGGGISDYFSVPPFQAKTTLPPSVNDGGHRRGVPDVAGNGDPETGYWIVVRGQNISVAGTSSVAPLWAGLTARLNQMMPPFETVGFFLPRLYKFPSAGRDITTGNNRWPANPAIGYDAGPGWDACTGLGSPNGITLAMILTQTGEVAAVEWSDGSRHFRVYCQIGQGVIQEYCWDGDGPWTTGMTLRGAAPYSRVAAVRWEDSRGPHQRVYYQNTGNVIVEQCYDDGNWTSGAYPLYGAAPGAGIAAVQWSDIGGNHIRVYYESSANTIIGQQRLGNGPWTLGTTINGAGPGSDVAAVQWSDSGGGAHVRVYYQNPGNAILEARFDNGIWTRTDTLFAAGPCTGIAATQWDSGGVKRVYFQNPQATLIEMCCDQGIWTAGNILPSAAPGTGIAAVGWDDDGGHLRIYYQNTQNEIIEECYDDEKWTPGVFAVPVK
jgi:kumamolisin